MFGGWLQNDRQGGYLCLSKRCMKYEIILFWSNSELETAPKRYGGDFAFMWG